ncbi:MAG TPA: hypothetical protein VGM14_04025 [Streptosporangiaceae bacterium]
MRTLRLLKQAVAQVPGKRVPAKRVPAKRVPAKQVPAKQVPGKQEPMRRLYCRPCSEWSAAATAPG